MVGIGFYLLVPLVVSVALQNVCDYADQGDDDDGDGDDRSDYSSDVFFLLNTDRTS